MDTPLNPKPATDWPTRAILGAVMASGLVVGTWSIYTLLRAEYGVPKEVALFGCVLFDLSALFFARLAQRAATSSDSGLAPRTAMLAMVGLSAAVNWKHAQMLAWGTTGALILAAAPVVAELAYEMWHRHEHREALRRHGRVARALPVVGRWAWLMHPLRARRVIDAHVQAALTVTERAAAHYAATGDDADRTTLTRITEEPAAAERITEAPQPQHVVITVRQEPIRELPGAESETPAPGEAHQGEADDAGASGSEAPRAPLMPVVPLGRPRPVAADAAQADTAALDLTGLTKAAAVMRITEAHPGASAPEIARRLAETSAPSPAPPVSSTETETSTPTPDTETSPTTETETENAGTPDETSAPDETRETETAPATQPATVSTLAPGDRETETQHLLDLIWARGDGKKVSLDDAIAETGRPKATAAKRLKHARELHAAGVRRIRTAA